MMGSSRWLGLLVACLSLTAQVASAEEPVLEIPVRVHVLKSKDDRALNANVSDAQVKSMFTKVNRIWSQAHIQWTIESVVQGKAQNSNDFRRLQQIGFNRDIPFQRKTMTSIYPKDNLLPGGWNLFIIEDFGVMPPGVYHPSTRCLIVAQRSNQVVLNPSIVAHELGHSLGLRHSTTGFNLMALAQNGVRPDQKIKLLPDQIERAREQAKQGKPFEGSLD